MILRLKQGAYAVTDERGSVLPDAVWAVHRYSTVCNNSFELVIGLYISEETYSAGARPIKKRVFNFPKEGRPQTLDENNQAILAEDGYPEEMPLRPAAQVISGLTLDLSGIHDLSEDSKTWILMQYDHTGERFIHNWTFD